MATHGVIDCYIYPSSSIEVYNEIYVSTIRFLTSSYAQSIGIQLVASYNGSSANGDDYWNSNKRYQTGAFSVWKFTSASVPFYMLMTYNTSNNTQVGNSSPCAYDDGTSYSGVAWAFASREDGGNPWGGTSLKQGADTKSTPVWTPGASNLYVWPRSNNTGGTHSVSRQGCQSTPQALYISQQPSYLRWHFVCDEEHVVMACDNNFDNSYMFQFFGKYTPMSGSTPLVPYVSFRSPLGANPPIPYAQTFGPTTAPAPSQWNGGAAHAHAPASGTRSCVVDYPDQTLHYIQFTPTSVGTNPWFYELPIHVAINESGHEGYIGYVDWIRHTWGVIGSTTSADKSRAYFGPSSLQSPKLSIPWDGATVPTTTFHRSGVMF